MTTAHIYKYCDFQTFILLVFVNYPQVTIVLLSLYRLSKASILYDIEIKYFRSSYYYYIQWYKWLFWSKGQSDVVPNSNNFCYFQYNHLFKKILKLLFVNKIALQLEEWQWDKTLVPPLILSPYRAQDIARYNLRWDVGETRVLTKKVNIII